MNRRFLQIFCLALGLFSLPTLAAAQKSKPKKPTATPAAAKKNPVTDGATRVGEQIKVLTRFLYVYGGITKDLAAADEASRKGQTSGAAAQQVRQNKAALIGSIRNLRDALEKLEADFRFTPQLQKYYPLLKGVADNAAAAEDAAAAGNYAETGSTLLEVVGQLTEVLVAMR